MRNRGMVALLGLLALAAGCSSGDDTSSAPTTAATSAPTTAAPTTTLPPATFTTRPGVEQIGVLDAPAGTGLEVVSADGAVAATGDVDAQGAFVARNLKPGSYVVRTTGAAPTATAPLTVLAEGDAPETGFYAKQVLPTSKLGYITTRDGTTLSAFISLPGDAAKGPYPTVVEYSGYGPSNPDDTTFATLFNTLGYAYVGVNMRGTGCSGGSYRFFETTQKTDGYDAIETVAAQPWVKDHKVGMVGISYPGISQLFVASTRPPSLAAITPLSVLADSYRSTLYPGGLLNTGFAVSWTQQRLDESKPFGQGWTKKRSDAGDTVCAENQKMRLQNPDLVAEIRDHPWYDPAIGDPIAPQTFVDKINVPVFIAGAWQDEQTGGHFATMLDKFTGAPHVYASLLNGLHTESLSPAVFPRYVEFLDLYVAKRVPSLAAARVIVPILSGSITGVSNVSLPADRFTGQTYEAALGTFESEPPVQVLFEEGAADGQTPGAPLNRFSHGFSAWPVPEAVPTSWYLGADGTLTSTAPTGDQAPSTYSADPKNVPATWYSGNGNDIWKADVAYDWKPVPEGTGVTFTSEPLAADTVVVGSGSADLWIAADDTDTDLEVTISEVRPDGSEVYVQSGWVRASHRTLDEAASTPTRPVQDHLEKDKAPLVPGTVTPVRVEIFPFAHPFRAGSRLRVGIDAPGGNRPVWVFETIAHGEKVSVSHDVAHPSKIVLAVVPGIEVPPGAPACGSLRGQPCRSRG